MNKVTLDNCDKEPIHIPGSIQANGALLAFSLSGELLYFSENASSVLGVLPAEKLDSSDLDYLPDAAKFILQYLEDANSGQLITVNYELKESSQRVYDLVIHAYASVVIAEFECRDLTNDDVMSFSIKVQKALNVIRQQKTTNAVMQAAATEVKLLTGFDRVMSYVFHQDDSGFIMAESKREDLDSLVNRHYPASDIPPQARRLYIENTLRLISDVHSQPIPILSVGTLPPLDMSHCVLRSVSTIHIEYLQNMGVGASMSISIVVNGRLWGLIACHHMASKQVPYSIRMACDVLCQILGSTVNQIETKAVSEQKVFASAERSHLSLKLLNSDNFVDDLLNSLDSLKKLIQCDALIVSYDGRVNGFGVSNEFTHELLEWAESLTDDYFQFSSINNAPDFFSSLSSGITGALGFCLDRSNRCWIIYMRSEKVHTISWSGKPEKEYKTGPHGIRLTPRGSFDEWKQTVKGQCEAWTSLEAYISKDLHLDLMKVANTKNAERNRIRTQLMAILGHDLRDPLNSISMANQMMQHQDGPTKLGERIKSSAGRMTRLIADVMDMAKLQGGMLLNVNPVETNFSSLVKEILDENKVGYPNAEIITDIAEVTARVDPDRMSQVVSNLLSNARHHGVVGAPIKIYLRNQGDFITLCVKNKGKEIDPDMEKILFNPFKSMAKQNDRNKTGMGLGLYISKEIMKAHNGDIVYSYDIDNGEVVFELIFSQLSS